MVNNKQVNNISKFFKVISDKTRLNILLLLQNKTLCVNDIVEAMKMEQSAISHQLSYLKNNGFVKSSKQSKTVYYQLACHHIGELISIATQHINKHNCK